MGPPPRRLNPALHVCCPVRVCRLSVFLGLSLCISVPMFIRVVSICFCAPPLPMSLTLSVSVYLSFPSLFRLLTSIFFSVEMERDEVSRQRMPLSDIPVGLLNETRQ